MRNQYDSPRPSRRTPTTERTLWWILFTALMLAAVMAAAWN